MTRARWTTAIPLLLVVIACGGPTGASVQPTAALPGSNVAIPSHLATLGMNGPRVESVETFISTLATAGVSCQGTTATPGPGNPALVKCRLGQDDVIAQVFESTDARNRYLAQVSGLLGQAGAEAVPQVAGPNWVVAADTSATVELIARTVGGEVVR